MSLQSELLAVEFGFVCGEKGLNLQATLAKYRELSSPQPAPLPPGYAVEKQADGSWAVFRGGGFVRGYEYLHEAIEAAKLDALAQGEL